MIKKLTAISSFLLFLFLSTSSALANEGVVKLAGRTDADGRCFAASVYLDGSYRVLMTCRGLKAALDPVKNRYVAWVDIDGKKSRIGEIVAGKLAGNIQDKFDFVFVTLEKDGYPNKPDESMVLTGRMEAIDFGNGVMDAAFAAPSVTPEQTVVKNNASTGTTAAVQSNTNRLVSIATGVGKAVVLGFVILLIVVAVMGFLARRKSL